MSHEVITHRTRTNGETHKADVNGNISIFASDVSGGGAHTVYSIEYGEAPVRLQFQTVMQVGITNETLLAIVHDRLTSFQAGEFACRENELALSAISTALYQLHLRTARRIAQGLEGKLKETHMADTSKEQPKLARVRVVDETLHIGKHAFEFKELEKWKAWSTVESVVKALNPQITGEELQLINTATLAIPNSSNGRTEFFQAINKTYHV